MTNLRNEARGRSCMVRSPVCNGDSSTTVLAHIRLSGISGMGFKVPDLLGAWACSDCHSLCDTGRSGGVEMEREDRNMLLLEGMARTQAALIAEEKVKW